MRQTQIPHPARLPKNSIRGAILLGLCLSSALSSPSASAARLVEAQKFDWAKFISKSQPSEVLNVALYVGGPNPFQENATSVRFRPASTQKIFTASAYLEKIGWNKKIPHFLKDSVNEIGDKILAPALGDGSLSKGAEAIENFVNAVIGKSLRRRGIEPKESECVDEYTQESAKKNPYRVYCKSGSGLDGSKKSLHGKDLERSLITAEAMHIFLDELKQKPYFKQLLRSLPYAGIDGTLKDRMGDGAAVGTVAAKTGTVDGIKNLAGYIHVKVDGKSKFVPFVILIRHNESNLGKVVKFADKLVNKMAEELGAEEIPWEPLK